MPSVLTRAAAAAGVAFLLAGCTINTPAPQPSTVYVAPTTPPPSTVYVAPTTAPPGSTVVVRPAQ